MLETKTKVGVAAALTASTAPVATTESNTAAKPSIIPDSESQGTTTTATDPDPVPDSAAVVNEDDDTDLSGLDLAALMPRAESSVSEEERLPLYVLKHKTCRTFSVGRFKFLGYQLKLYTRKDVEEFGEAFQGLEPMHRNAIVALDSIAMAKAQTPFQPTITRGAASTSRIPDPKSVQ